MKIVVDMTVNDWVTIDAVMSREEIEVLENPDYLDSPPAQMIREKGRSQMVNWGPLVEDGWPSRDRNVRVELSAEDWSFVESICRRQADNYELHGYPDRSQFVRAMADLVSGGRHAVE